MSFRSRWQQVFPLSARWQQARHPWQVNRVEPEDSIALRIWVQGLVAVGIAAVSVAAVGVAPASLFNLLAIPLSAIGAYWSWTHRRRSNIGVKFVIALGMLLALGFFLAQLLGRGGDTRILLAELLIHLLVLHSFDMPRRKDLGYSIVIALILMGVSATISQTLSFAPMLLMFLAIALPVMMLDYRSRLGLRGWGGASTSASSVPWRRLAALLGITLTVGLLIFALLPRFPGYQIRNFPVSGTINFQGEFTGDRVLNPGYSSDGSRGPDGQGNGMGTSDDGPGQFDGTFYYGFNDRMNQNLRGSMEPQVMFRVRSQAPGFWRVLAFDRYTGQGWEISQRDDVEILERSYFSYKTVLPDAAMQPMRRDNDGRRREVIQTFTLVNAFPNLLPAMYQAHELYFPTRSIAIDAEGSLRSPVLLQPGLTYTVVSEVPYRDRTLLRQARTDYSPRIQERYFQVPEAIRDRVREQTEALMAESPIPLTDPYEKALYLAQALKQNYTVQPELPFFEDDEDLVEAFLFRYGGGYPDHFSTVLTVMLRSIGIPSRVVAGFSSGDFNPFTGYYVVSNTDAFTMTEVYFPGYGWFGFNPIPGLELLPPEIRDSQTFSVLRQFWNWIAGWLPTPVTSWITGVVTQVFLWLGRVIELLGRGWVGAIAGFLGATGLAFLGWLSWQSWRRWQHYRWLRRLDPMEQVYQRLLGWLAVQGYPKAPYQTSLEHAITLQSHLPTEDAAVVGAIARAYVSWRYGQHPQDVEALAAQVRSLQKRQGWRSQLRALLDRQQRGGAIGDLP
ncbi:MAG: DUF3488 domain-containing protein [Leptolyngbyaceae cyanobacterium T60_A2020_046]|nr:DUF3488 domain-containing protein [Leptolyngbyaceae cyanobacterium T60_A2020_046]